jgi:H+-translocating NAD(P) transhydrogenase subunit alpha
VITTAAVPGRPAPKIIPASAVEAMRPGSVIVDLAAETGGNCELTVPGEVVVRDGVTIVGTLNLPSTMPLHASQMYARNITNLLALIVKDGELALDFEDEIVADACITHDGAVVSKLLQKATA